MSDRSQSPEQRHRIVFSLLHSGYLRHYAEPIRILVARGHSVHLALHREDAKDRGDDRLLERLLSECPAVTVSTAPKRHRFDGWRPVAWIVRSLVDTLRYSESRYQDAGALRARAASKLRDRVAGAAVDPISRRLVLRLVDSIEAGRNPRRLGVALRALAAVEDAIPACRRTKKLIGEQRASIVLASPVVDFGSPQVEFIKSARRLRIPCAVCVASWDNLTNKGLLRVVPDRVIVWNARQRDELVEMHGVPRDRVVLTGGQKFDPWFELSASTTREDFGLRIGLDPAKPYLLYVCSSRFVAPDEVPAVSAWVAAVRASGGVLEQAGIMIRPHPQNARQWKHADLTGFESVSVWPRSGEYPDEGQARSDFFDSIFHSAAVVGVNTSAQIEAGIIGRPVYTILLPSHADTQSGTPHFQYLRRANGGFVNEADSMETHLAQLRSGMDGPETRENITGFIESFVRPRGLALPVAPIVADEIERLGQDHVSEPDPTAVRLRRLLLRGALSPVGLALSAVAVILAIRDQSAPSRAHPRN